MALWLVVAEIARWSYFSIAVLSIINSFLHLQIQFELSQCPSAWINHLGGTTDIENQFNAEVSCIGRNLGWRANDNFDFDTNLLFWRQTFSLRPDIFLDVWPPLIVSALALLQHFDTFKWKRISGDWTRSLLFIIAWQLFCVLGYGSNFGVIVGLLALCGLAPLYLCVCIASWTQVIDTDLRDKPVLNLLEYVPFCALLMKHKNTDSDNDGNEEEQQALSAQPVMQHKQIGSEDAARHRRIDTDEFMGRLSLTQPGSSYMSAAQNSEAQKLKQRPLPPVPAENQPQSQHHDGMSDAHSNYDGNEHEPDGSGHAGGGVTPGGGMGGGKRRRKKQYAEIGQQDKSSEDEQDSVVIHEEEMKQNEVDAEEYHTKDQGQEQDEQEIVYKESDNENDMVMIPRPQADDRQSSSNDEDEHDGLYKKPHYRKTTES